jgi:fructose-specific phosphotransferase system IIC component
MNKSKKMDSCTELFKTMSILPLYSQHIFSLLMYVVNNKHLFTKTLGVKTMQRMLFSVQKQYQIIILISFNGPIKNGPQYS